MAIEDATPHHVVENLMAEPERGYPPQRPSTTRMGELGHVVREVARQGDRGVARQRHVEFFEHTPDRVETRREQRHLAIEGRDHHALESEVLRRLDLLDSPFYIVKVDVRLPG